METMELETQKRPRGRPRVPASERKVPVSTTLDQATYAVIEERMWQLNELIMLGVQHRTKCPDRDAHMLEMMETIRIQGQAIDKLNAKIQEISGGAQ